MVFKNILSKKLINEYISLYEENDIFLKKNSKYYRLKNEILSKKIVTCDNFSTFIEDTKGNKYTSFIKLNKKYIENKNFEWDIKLKNFLYLSLKSFTKGIYKEIKSILENNDKQYLIIDLRDNFGGNLEECIKICNLFLSKCEIIKIDYKNKSTTYYAYDSFYEFKKILIWVNENTASCAEVLALSLRCNLKQVKIIGNKTVGKSIGQKTIINKRNDYIFNISAFKWEVNNLNVEDLFKYIENDTKSETLNGNDYFNSIYK